MHAGWACKSGLTAASFAVHGIIAPQAPYTGRYSLYRSHLSDVDAAQVQLETATAGLDASGQASVRELMQIAVKPCAILSMSPPMRRLRCTAGAWTWLKWNRSRCWPTAKP